MARKPKDKQHDRIDELPPGLPAWVGAYKPGVKLVPLKDDPERVNLTFTIPVYCYETKSECRITMILKREDVHKLAWARRDLLGFELSVKLGRAALALLAEKNPPPLERKRHNALLKQTASQVAKWIHPTIKTLFQHPEYQSEMFRQTIKEAEKAYGGKVNDSRQITAWIIERMYEFEWDSFGLDKRKRPSIQRPTHYDSNKFGRAYLYTEPHMLPCTKKDLPEKAEAIERILRKILYS